MIADVLLRPLYLIFACLVSWLTLLPRASSSKNIELLVAAARARVREVAWAQRADTTGHAFAHSRVAGTAGLGVLVIDLDTHVLVCHCEKEQTAPTFSR